MPGPASPPCAVHSTPTPGSRKVAAKIKDELGEFGLLDAPLGVDVIELPVLLALQSAGITVVDGQQTFMEARRVKTQDEITLLTQAASMVDAAYEDLYQFLRPGVKENECVAWSPRSCTTWARSTSRE